MLHSFRNLQNKLQMYIYCLEINDVDNDDDDYDNGNDMTMHDFDKKSVFSLRLTSLVTDTSTIVFNRLSTVV